MNVHESHEVKRGRPSRLLTSIWLQISVFLFPASEQGQVLKGSGWKFDKKKVVWRTEANSSHQRRGPRNTACSSREAERNQINFSSTATRKNESNCGFNLRTSLSEAVPACFCQPLTLHSLSWVFDGCRMWAAALTAGTNLVATEALCVCVCMQQALMISPLLNVFPVRKRILRTCKSHLESTENREERSKEKWKSGLLYLKDKKGKKAWNSSTGRTGRTCKCLLGSVHLCLISSCVVLWEDAQR